MSFTIQETSLPGVLLIQPQVFDDQRMGQTEHQSGVGIGPWRQPFG